MPIFSSSSVGDRHHSSEIDANWTANWAYLLLAQHSGLSCLPH